MVVSEGVKVEQWKTPLEIAQRDVAKAEARVARQAASVAELKAEGRDTTNAEAILEGHKALLRFLQEDLEYLKVQKGLSKTH
jgi:hypothetical protein